MAGLCEGGNEPPGSLKANTWHDRNGISSDSNSSDEVFLCFHNGFIHQLLHMPPEEETRHVRSGDLGGQATGPPRPIHRFPKGGSQMIPHSNAEMGWRPIVLEVHPLSNIQRYILQLFRQHVFQEVVICPSVEAKWKNSLMLAGSEFQSLGRAIVKEDEYEEVRWDGIVSIVS
ncbi:hypothetical protein ANN_24088 [Periplaneta americana]|uniref:Uncharacterized protein n=1 Tax=Periplaneta americana TaxID=6978 RepID=A0ABQ8S2F2_PERAM|nr:hypothetical protein ANN_24088 [Periplaneta americana]